MKENWYDKFNRKSEVADSKNKRKEFNKERDKFFEAKRRKALEKHQDPSFSQKKTSCKIDGIITETEHLFITSSLPHEYNDPQFLEGRQPFTNGGYHEERR